MGIHVAESHFQVVAENPNPNGRCLFAPHGEHDGCEGPYIQFNAVAASLAEAGAGPERMAAVACVRCLKEAIADADSMIGAGQMTVGAGSSQPTMAEKMEAQPKPTMDFESLPPEEQDRLLRDVGPGETVRFPEGVVLIPGQRKQRQVIQSEPLSAPSPFSIVGITGEALHDPGEVPARKRGEYETASDGEDILAEIAEG